MWIKWQEAYDIFMAQFPEITDAKTIENWFWAEMVPEKVGTRNGYQKEEVESWIARIKTGIVALTLDDYKTCLKFAIESFYMEGFTKSDFMRGKQRDMGEFLTNQIQGKLGELAVAKLLASRGLTIELDFNVTGQIPSQDVTRVSIRSRVWDNPTAKVSIKTTKLKNVFLPIPEVETTLVDRQSDVYVLSQVGLPPDHLIRVLKTENLDVLAPVRTLIPDFGPVVCRVGGWISRDDLVRTKLYTSDESESELGIRFAKPNYVLTPNKLSQDWDQLCKKVYGGWEPRA
ncbi:hypothetical protein BH09BAC3_BH09BAC3_29910 [soil metagenome]